VVAQSNTYAKSLGILSIATNVYLRYWMVLARSVDQHIRAFSPVTLHVFTDQITVAKEFAETLSNVTVKVHEITALGWPEATLLRFKIFLEHSEEFAESFLIHLDADSVIDQDLEPSLAEMMTDNGVLLVEQSGSWRPKKLSKLLRFYFLHPGAVFADLKKIIWEGGLGTWEKNQESSAFVPRSKRKSYVYGAVWMGVNAKFMELVGELSERVDADWQRGIVAKWHDESHLNWWNSEYRPTLLDPRYYFFPGQHHLDELPSIIRLVHKDEITR